MTKEVFYQEAQGSPENLILNVVYRYNDFLTQNPGPGSQQMLDNPGVWYKFGPDGQDYMARVLP